MSSIEMFYYKKHKQKLYNHLRESFGVREYRNEHLDRKIFEAADRINDYVKNSFHSSDNLNNAVLKMNGTVTSCYYFPMHISDCCNWLNTLNIVVCIDKNVDSELDVYVLNDSYTYNVVHNLNTGVNEMKLCSLNINLYDNDMHNIVYSRKKDIATIVFKIPYRHIINPIEFECIIHHEFSHISDIQNKELKDLNNDLIHSGLIYVGEDFANEIQILNDLKISYTDKKNIIQKCKDKSNLLSDFIAIYMYYLNISEMRAHLVNFKYDLINGNLPKMYNLIHEMTGKKLLQNYDSVLTNNSNTYALYRNLLNVLKIFLDVMNKEEFIVFKDYVDVLFNRNSDDGKHILGDFIHDTDFSKHDGDYILNFYINRIKKIFIKNAINIAVDILSPDDKFSLYTIMDRLKMKKENR